MEKHVVKVLKADFVTHNVKRFVVEKPLGLAFVPGQATEISINKPGFMFDLRPFTFTCVNDDDHLEFIIKIYEITDGMTQKLLDVHPGDELILHDIFGVIQYRGPGLFIAGGTGITPFISIFRHLKANGGLDGNALLFANKTENDVILKEELTEMFGDDFVSVLSNPIAPLAGSFIDKAMLKRYTDRDMPYYYICGPERFTNYMVDSLQDLGITKDRIVVEE